MLETLLGFSIGTALGMIGILAAIVSIITEVLKKILPQKFPTKILVMIISLIVAIVVVLIFYEISAKMIILSIAGSFIVAFISMYGWDTFKELINRFKVPEIKGDDKNGE